MSVTLWALATRTQIENATSGLSGGAFDAVVTDVRHFAGLIKPKFDAVLARASHLRTTAATARDRTKTFVGREATELAVKVESTRKDLATVRSMRTAARTLSGEAVKSSEDLSRKVTAVLTALQMHDITRQMFEHVRDALGDLAQTAEDAMKSSGSRRTKLWQRSPLGARSRPPRHDGRGRHWSRHSRNCRGTC